MSNFQNPSVEDTGPSTSSTPTPCILQCIDEELLRRLEDFVLYFVTEVETRAFFHHKILEGKASKIETFSEPFIKYVSKGAGAIAGGLLSFVLTATIQGAGMGAAAAEPLGEMLGKKEAKSRYTKKIAQERNFLNYFRRGTLEFRSYLVEAAIIIFYSFERQFSRVTKRAGDWKAMQKFAIDATNRLFHFSRINEVTCIAMAVLYGKSKVEPILGITLSDKMKTPGFTVKYKYESSEIVWYTKSVFEETGIVLEAQIPNGTPSYYQKKRQGESRTSKYGFRRLIETEDWENMKDEYELANISESAEFITDYTLCLEDYKKLTPHLMQVVNSQDISSERIKKSIEDSIVYNTEILELARQECKQRGEDHSELKDLIASLKTSSTDDYLEEMIQFITIKKEIKKVASEIKDGMTKTNDTIVKGHNDIQQKIEDLNKMQEVHHNDNTEYFEIFKAGLSNIEKKVDHELEYTKQICERFKTQDSETITFDVLDPVTSFVGRKEEIVDLHKKIMRTVKEPNIISQITVITGSGGMGKTELTQKYISMYRDSYHNVIWLNAENETTLSDSFIVLAKDILGIKTSDANGAKKKTTSIVQEVYKFFSKKKSLFIFDDAEDSKYLKTFLPIRSIPNANKPYILITSRNQVWDKGIECINLEELEMEDAIKFIKTETEFSSNSQDEKDMQTLAQELQQLPLALQQAVAYMQQNTEYSIQDYLKEFKQKAKAFLDYKIHDKIDNHYRRTTFTTWKMTKDKITQKYEYGKLAIDILSIIAYLYSEKINTEMFNHLATDEKVVKLAVDLLVNYSMLKGDQQKKILRVHRLVQKVTQLELQDQEKDEIFFQKTFEILKHNIPRCLSDHVIKKYMLPHLEKFIAHIDDRTEDETKMSTLDENNETKKQRKLYLAKLLDWTAQGHNQYGNPQRQIQLLHRQLMVVQEVLGSEHRDIFRAKLHLGIAYGDTGDMEKQKTYLEEALKLLQQRKCDKTAQYDLVKVLRMLGNVHIAQGNIKNAEHYLNNALNFQKHIYESNNPEIGRTYAALGHINNALGNYTKAVNMLELSLHKMRQCYKSDNYEIALTQCNLCVSYAMLGKHEKAKNDLEKALQFLQEHYTSDHYKVAYNKGRLGVIYGYLGDIHKEKNILEDSLEILLKDEGPHNVEASYHLEHLGKVHQKFGDFEKSKVYFLKEFKILQKYGQEDNINTASPLFNLGTTCGELREEHQQIKFQCQALEILQRHFNKDTVMSAAIKTDLAIAYGKLNLFKKKKELLQEVSTFVQNFNNKFHSEILDETLEKLGCAFRDEGNYQISKEILLRVLKEKESFYGHSHIQVAQTYTNLGIAVCAEGMMMRNDEKLDEKSDIGNRFQYCEIALQIAEKYEGPEVCKVLAESSAIYYAFEIPTKGKDLLERAFNIQKKYGYDENLAAKTIENFRAVSKILLGADKHSKLIKDVSHIKDIIFGFTL